MSVSHSLHLSLSLCSIVLMTRLWNTLGQFFGQRKNTDCDRLSSSVSTSLCLEEGVLVVNGSCSPSFPLLALHPFQLEERWIPIAFLALFRPAAGSTSSRGLRFAPSVLRRGWGRRASGRQRRRWWLGRTTGSAGQVHSQRWGLMESQGGAW